MTPDEQIDSLVRSQSGRAVLASINPYIQHREDQLLKQLIAESDAGSLTEHNMRARIAGIAALRSLKRDIERDVNVATHQSRHLVAQEESHV